MKGRKIKREVIAPKRIKKKSKVRITHVPYSPELTQQIQASLLKSGEGESSHWTAFRENVKELAAPQRGDRHNSSKPRMSLILEAQFALVGLSRVLEFGQKKYSRANWRKGLPSNEIVDSLARHLVAYQSGETHDVESKLPLVDHILCNALFLAELVRPGSEWDDRPILRNPRS